MFGKTPERLETIAPFYVMSLLARAKELEAAGKDVIHLEVGEPDFKTPDAIVEAGIEAMRNGHMGYTPTNGIVALREAIAGFYQNNFGVSVDPERIFITPGASGALQLAMLACLDSDEALLLTEPGYPCNRHIAQALGIDTQLCVLDAKTGYLPNVAQLEAAATEQTRALLMASPGNPTGTVIPDNLIGEMSALCRQRQWHFIMDEIYAGLVYDNVPAKTVLSRHPNAWVVQSFSKYFQMTGWRLGWLIVPAGYESVVSKLAQNLYLSAPTIAQHAAVRAFQPDVLSFLDSRRTILESRRDFLVSGLEAIGFPVVSTPDGAFYVYVDVSDHTDDSLAFCQELLESTAVAVAPGIDFGGANAATTVRFAYTQDQLRIEEALKRMKAFVNARQS